MKCAACGGTDPRFVHNPVSAKLRKLADELEHLDNNVNNFDFLCRAWAGEDGEVQKIVVEGPRAPFSDRPSWAAEMRFELVPEGDGDTEIRLVGMRFGALPEIHPHMDDVQAGSARPLNARADGTETPSFSVSLSPGGRLVVMDAILEWDGVHLKAGTQE